MRVRGSFEGRDLLARGDVVCADQRIVKTLHVEGVTFVGFGS